MKTTGVFSGGRGGAGLSFSEVTKNELARVVGPSSCCRLAELAALVKMGGSIQIRGKNRLALNVGTENVAVARKIFLLGKSLYGLRSEVLIQRKPRLQKNNVYLVCVPSQSGVKKIMADLGIIDETGRLHVSDKLKEDLVRKDCCRRAYLRGSFLGGGSVNDPAGTYHLEVVAGSEKHARFIGRLMRKFHLAPGISRRKKRYVVYLKESEQIVALLNITGAHSALLKFENARVCKDVRNHVNRLVNCETANLNKTVNAAVRQLENINLVKETIGLKNLPETIREVSELRLQYPDVNLRELGQLMFPPVGKSGINYRFRKLEEIAEKLRQGECERHSSNTLIG
jgi:hypothetical protein